MSDKEPSTILPADAIAQLQRAALTPVTEDDPLARVKAIEQITRRIKTQHPHLFKGIKDES